MGYVCRFREIYRLPRRIALDFLDELSSVMDENKAPDIPLTVQFCCVLNFYASGSYQRRVGQDAFAAMSQTCVSRCVTSISRTIATKLMEKYVIFPQSIGEIKKLSLAFENIDDFPGVFALVDGTHVVLRGLKRSIDFLFKNRNKTHSINTQVIIDRNMRFLNVNARYPENLANEMGDEWQYELYAW